MGYPCGSSVAVKKEGHGVICGCGAGKRSVVDFVRRPVSVWLGKGGVPGKGEGRST